MKTSEGHRLPNGIISVGCSTLDRLQINMGSHGVILDRSLNIIKAKPEEIGACVNCASMGCVYDTKHNPPPKTQITEVYVQCSKCLTTETLTLFDGHLGQHSRFSQIGRGIYHNIDSGWCYF